MNTEVLKLGKYFGNQSEINNNNKTYLQALTPNEHDFFNVILLTLLERTMKFCYPCQHANIIAQCKQILGLQIGD